MRLTRWKRPTKCWTPFHARISTNLRGELGDLLFRWCSTRRWRRKRGALTLTISAPLSATKLERRHPHIFR
ncbi:MazG nucleotide pyrophosphohydrolase domain-containing protein [Enterobacter hormaechei]